MAEHLAHLWRSALVFDVKESFQLHTQTTRCRSKRYFSKSECTFTFNSNKMKIEKSFTQKNQTKKIKQTNKQSTYFRRMTLPSRPVDAYWQNWFVRRMINASRYAINWMMMMNMDAHHGYECDWGKNFCLAPRGNCRPSKEAITIFVTQHHNIGPYILYLLFFFRFNSYPIHFDISINLTTFI